MMDLAAIKKANRDPAGFYRSRLSDGQTELDPVKIVRQQKAHGDRVEARQRTNGEAR